MSESTFDRDAAEKVQDYVNLHTLYATTQHHYGKDLWESALKDGKGVADCKGYAIEKTEMLLENGWPRNQVRLWICTYVDDKGDVIGHAVGSVIVGGQEWILDNRYPDLMKPQALPYKWIKSLHFEDGKWYMAKDYTDHNLVVTFTPAPVKT